VEFNLKIDAGRFLVFQVEMQEGSLVFLFIKKFSLLHQYYLTQSESIKVWHQLNILNNRRSQSFALLTTDLTTTS